MSDVDIDITCDVNNTDISNVDNVIICKVVSDDISCVDIAIIWDDDNGSKLIKLICDVINEFICNVFKIFILVYVL